MQLIRYGILRRMRRGIRLGIFPTYRCNLRCHYCTLYISDKKELHGIWPGANEVDLADWLDFIDNFPLKIKEIFVTGGEPSLVKYIDSLVRELLNRGYLVTVFSNLARVDCFIELPRSPRLRFVVTYHHGKTKKEAFMEKYRKLKSRKFNVRVEEIATQELRDSMMKKLNTPKESQSREVERDTLRISPDLKIFCTCMEMYDNARTNPVTEFASSKLVDVMDVVDDIDVVDVDNDLL